MRVLKREGDGATPSGRFEVRRLLFRRDRGRPPFSGLQTAQLRQSDGWCDAPSDPNYNRPVRHPYCASAEHMWREDHLYDLVLVLGHNDRPRQRGRGSAIFVHLARADYAPTAGCIALTRGDFCRLLAGLRPGARFDIQ